MHMQTRRTIWGILQQHRCRVPLADMTIGVYSPVQLSGQRCNT